jgi:hypothetical protein
MRKPDWAPEDGDPIAEAIRTFDPRAPEGLCSVLLDEDPIVRCRGLYVFGQLGRKGFVVLDAALRSIDHPNVGARSDLMDGVISYSKQLRPCQAHIVLKLAGDPEDLVREKVAAFLGAAVKDVIESAIDLFEEPLRSSYRRAFAKFSAEPSQAQTLLQEGLADISVPAIFALASIQRMARDGRLVDVPLYSGDSYLGRGVVANVARLMRGARPRPPQGLA